MPARASTYISLESLRVVYAEEEDNVTRIPVCLCEQFFILDLCGPSAFIYGQLDILMVPRFNHEISTSTSL
jgi:hypothetical protein